MEYQMICKELHSVIDDLRSAKNDLIQKRQNHELSRVEVDNAFDKIQNHITYIHKLFVTDCYEISNHIYNSHIYELASRAKREIIKMETQKTLLQFVTEFKDNLDPLIIRKIIFEDSESLANIKDGFSDNYLTVDSYGNLERNMNFIKQYILELFGFKN